MILRKTIWWATCCSSLPCRLAKPQKMFCFLAIHYMLEKTGCITTAACCSLPCGLTKLHKMFCFLVVLQILEKTGCTIAVVQSSDSYNLSWSKLHFALNILCQWTTDSVVAYDLFSRGFNSIQDLISIKNQFRIIIYLPINTQKSTHIFFQM